MDLDFALAYPDAAPGNAYPASYDGPAMTVPHECEHEHEEQKPQVCPTPVPSQWKLGAALDRLRFPQYGGDWDTMIATVTGRRYERTLPRSDSPLSADDIARKSYSARDLPCRAWLIGLHVQASPR